jgi:phosphoribosylformylglycinamidine (FGAM) synthase-like amidotransferase family enzyme
VRAPGGSARPRALRRLPVGAVAMAVSHAAGAFTLSDGTTTHCFTAGQAVLQYGRGNDCWRETLACANAPDKPAPPPVPH